MLGLQRGTEVVADEIAQPPQVAVRWVVYRRQPELFELRVELRSSDIEERSDQGAAARSHGCQTFEPRAAEQADEDRLDLVVTMVGRRDVTAVAGAPATLEEIVSGTPRPILDPSVHFRHRARVGFPELERCSDPVGDRLRPSSPLTRARVEVMVQMGGNDLEALGGAQLLCRMEQSGGVGASRESDDQAVAPVEWRYLGEEVIQARQEHRLGESGGGERT